MLPLSLIILVAAIILSGYSVYSLKKTKQINKNVEEYNQQLDKTNQNLTQENIVLESERKKLINNIDVIKKEFFNENQNYRDIKQEVLVANKELTETKRHLNDIQSNILKTTETQKELSQKAFENYCEVLEKQYKEKEKEYDMYKDTLETSYSNRQLELMREVDEIQKELDSIKATRAAAIKAQTREKEIEEKLSFYCLTIPETELKDIGILESIAPKLNKERVLWMLIWQTFFRTPMTSLCNNVIGNTVKSGIYKITNIKTKECYIGQAVDLASRWKDHAKCGLHIDTPAGNKLYKAMQEYGIQNFSWEVLEEVPPAQLNKKEDYYIQLYDSINFGYNSIKAPKKGIK